MADEFVRKLFIAKGGQYEIEVKVQFDSSNGEEKITDVFGKNINHENRHEKDDLRTFAFKELRYLYSKDLERNYENLVVLTGAGASKGIGLGEKKGLLTSEFWPIINDFLDREFKTKESLAAICKSVDYHGPVKDIEALLSWLFLIQQLDLNNDRKIIFESTNEGIKIDAISKLIENKIRELCDLIAPEDSPQKKLLEKLSKRKQSSPRVKLFTLNYDTLFEQAASQINSVLIDGFSFNLPRLFSGRNFDYDIVRRENSKLGKDKNYLERVFHLYKLHGSINWEKRKDGEIILTDVPDVALMIYPRGNKYEASYEQPYFEMMSRLQTALRQGNTTLLVIGYSFSDKHINTVIIEAFNQNPSFNLIVVDPYFSDSDNELVKTLINNAYETSRITLIGETFSDFANNIPENQSYEEIEQTRINYPPISVSKNTSQNSDIPTIETDDQDLPF